MSKHIHFSNKTSFVRDVVTLVTGSGLAVAIPILISPILTRLYTPQDMGVLAVFSSVVAVLGSVSNGRFELAILIPEKNIDAIHLFCLGFIINVSLTILVILMLFFFGDSISSIISIDDTFLLMFIPIAIFFSGLLNLLNAFNNRIKRYPDIAKATFLRSASLVSIQLLIGIVKKGSLGLILGETFSKLFSNLKLSKNIFKNGLNKKNIKKYRLKKLFIRFKKFPLLDVPATLFNVSAFQLIPIFFNLYFSASTAGLFYLTQRVLGAPVVIIANAISDVFKERSSKDYIKYNNAKDIYLKTFKKLIAIGLLPSLLVFFFAEDLFLYVFGEEWRVAGLYAKIMIPMLYLRFVSNPLSFMFYLGEKQRVNLILQFVLLLLVILSFVFFKNDIEVVVSLSISFSFFYLLQIFFSSNIAKAFYK